MGASAALSGALFGGPPRDTTNPFLPPDHDGGGGDSKEVAPPRLLIVDDEWAVRRAMVHLFSRQGFQVTEAGDVAEALRMWEQVGPDIILCDVDLPDANGLELVARLSGHIPSTAFVMVTGTDSTEVASEALRLGAFGYVVKPFNVNELLIQVHAAMVRRRHDLERQAFEEELTRRVREKTSALRESQEELAVRLLAASKLRDTETGSHIRRMGLYAGEIARLVGWSVEQVDLIRPAASLHDVGKIGVPDHILRKPGPHTPEERAIMRTHCEIGAELLAGSKLPLLEMGRVIALCHHERWDGGGYPAGLQGDEIPLAARITALADVYDALCNRRVYKEAWTEDQALALVASERGRHFDPTLVDVFLENADVFCTLRLSCPD